MGYGVYDNESRIIVLEADSKREAEHLRKLLYIQDKNDGCLVKGCYSVHKIPWN